MLRKCRRQDATIRDYIIASDLNNNDSTLFWKHVLKKKMARCNLLIQLGEPLVT